MLKTISAALLAVSVIAAPALAATADKTAPAPSRRRPRRRSPRRRAAPVIKAEQSKSKLLNANASMGRHHHKHYAHHRHHKHMGALKTHAAPKFAVKHVTSARQARLKLIRRRGSIHIAPPRRRISGPARRAIASPMAVGRYCVCDAEPR